MLRKADRIQTIAAFILSPIPLRGSNLQNHLSNRPRAAANRGPGIVAGVSQLKIAPMVTLGLSGEMVTVQEFGPAAVTGAVAVQL